MSAVSRFAVEKSYYRPSDNTVKPKAFLPKDGTTSVFCFEEHQGHAEVIQHGNTYVGELRGKPVLGYASVQRESILSEGLMLLESVPPPQHWNIAGWPHDEDACKTLAIALAEHSVFIPA